MSRIQVAVGIIRNSLDDTVLLSLRHAGKIQGGKWEFPGGKLEQNESVLEALKREVFEETGIRVESAHPLVQVDHDDENLRLTLHAWCVDGWNGRAEGREGQKIEWVKRSELARKSMPSVNAAILAAYNLPPLYLITPDLEKYDQQFLRLIDTLLKNGLRLLQFRSRRSSFAEHNSIVKELVQMCSHHTCRLLYNGSIEEAVSIGAHGVHLRSNVLEQSITIPHERGLLVSASCHSIEQILHANRMKSDFCVLAPVHNTASHPDISGMGWPEFRKIAGHSIQPVYALGGISPHELAEAHANGAHGIAMISGIWSAEDPVAALQQAVGR